MSVIFFGSDELGNLAKVLAPGASEYERERFRHYCKALSAFSKANGACFQAQYGEPTEGWFPEEISSAAPSPVHIQRRKACDTAILLDYNLYTNGGEYHGSLEIRETIIGILTSLLRDASRKAWNEARKPIIPASAPGQPVSILDMLKGGEG